MNVAPTVLFPSVSAIKTCQKIKNSFRESRNFLNVLNILAAVMVSGERVQGINMDDPRCQSEVPLHNNTIPMGKNAPRSRSLICNIQNDTGNIKYWSPTL